MALNIKSDKADELAREIARATGRSITDVVIDALEKERARLGDGGTLARKARAARIHAICEAARAIPAKADLSIDAITGYDEMEGLR